MLGIAGGAAAILAGVAAGAMAINAAKSMLFGSRGSNAARPMYTSEVGGGGGGGSSPSSAIGGISESLGGGKRAGMGKQLKTLFKNPKVMGRALKRSGGGSMMKGLGKGLLKKIPYLGALIGGGMEIAEGGFNVESLSRAALSGGGAALGGLLGGIGGLGAASVPLGIAGGIGGSMAGDWVGDKIFGERPETADDFIIRPGQKPLKFRKDDVIMGGTNLTGNATGDTGGGKVEALLQELIAAVKQGGNIHIGANKLNEAIGINLHPMR
jgi:hypothetical protein